MKIKTRVLAAVAFSVAGFLALGGVALRAQSQMDAALLSVQTQMEKLAMMTQLELAISEAVMPGNDYIITGKAQYAADFEKLDGKVRSCFKRIRDSRGFGQEELDLIAKSERYHEGICEVSRKIFAASHRDPSLPELMEKMDYDYASPAVESVGAIHAGLEKQLAAVREQSDRTRNGARFALFGTVLVFVTVGGGLGFRFSRAVVRPIEETTEMLRHIAEGDGDLTRRIEYSGSDEVGALATWFNRFVESMQGTVSGVVATAQEITNVSGEIRNCSVSVQTAADRQMVGVEASSSCSSEMYASVRSINDETEALLAFTREVAGTSLEMSASAEEIAEHSARMDDLSATTASSAAEIAATVRQVAGNVAVLDEETEEIATAISGMDAAAGEAMEHSRLQAALSAKVREAAAGAGVAAVRSVREGMDLIRQDVASTATAVERLKQMSSDVGGIMNFISDTAGSTNLLALNASIIAAQAGEHGRPFAVVAGEIKELAKKTAGATDRTSDLISAVQEEIDAVVKLMERSLSSVEQGFVLAAQAETALREIIESSESSLDMARRIEIVLVAQSASTAMILEGIRRGQQMAKEIRTATDEQRRATEEIAAAASVIKDFAGMIHQSTVNQAAHCSTLSGRVAEASERMRAIAVNTDEQRSAAEIIVRTMEETREEAEKSVELSRALETMVVVLEREKARLAVQVRNFTV